MRKKVFVDTSAFYALADGRDGHHAQAQAVYKNLLEQKTVFVLTDHILAESATLIRRRLGYDAAQKFLHLVEAGEGTGLFSIESANRERLGRAKSIFGEMRDPKLSLVDALSFAVMNELSLRHCLAFDEHFRQAGFELIP